MIQATGGIVSEGPLLVAETASVPHAGLTERAGEVAAALGLDVFVCCIQNDAGLPPPLPGKRERMQRLMQRRLARGRRALDRRLAAMQADGVRAEGSVALSDSFRETVLDRVHEQSASLLMMLWHAHTALERRTLAGDDFALVRESPVPVWIVRPGNSGRTNVVAAVGSAPQAANGESLEDRILDQAAILAGRLRKQSHALYTFGQAGAVSEPIEPPAENPQDDMGMSRTDERIRRIRELASSHGIAPEHAHVYEGRLERVLAEEADAMDADLVVVGDRDAGRLRRVLSGGSAEAIIEQVPTDVLVMKPSAPVRP